jgi:hypothetical protein
MFCEGASWFWTMAQFFAIGLSLWFIYGQIRLQRLANMLQTLGSLDNRWNSKEMVEARKRACGNYSQDQLRINREQGDILAFFEDVGIYLQRGVFDTESVWDKYSYYVEHYWAMYQPYIAQFREESKDNTWYEKFEMLKNRTERFSKKKGLNVVAKTHEDLKRFIKVEES